MPCIFFTCYHGILYQYILAGRILCRGRRYGIKTCCQVTLRTETNVAISIVVDILAILAQERLDHLSRYSHLHAISSRSGVVLSHTEQYRARWCQLSFYFYWEIVIIVERYADWLVGFHQFSHIHLVPYILVSLQFVAAFPVEWLCIGASIAFLHIDAECKWIICSQLEHQLGHVCINEFANKLEELTWNANTKLTVVDWLAKHLCRNLSFCLGQDAILAIYCHTCGQVDGVCAQVFKCETRRLAHVLQQSVREFIPCSTWVVDIFLTRHYLYMIDTIRWFCHCSIDKSCTQLQFATSDHSYIYIINRCSSYETIVNQLIYAHTWHYRDESWYNRLEWTSE